MGNWGIIDSGGLQQVGSICAGYVVYQGVDALGIDGGEEGGIYIWKGWMAAGRGAVPEPHCQLKNGEGNCDGNQAAAGRQPVPVATTGTRDPNREYELFTITADPTGGTCRNDRYPLHARFKPTTTPNHHPRASRCVSGPRVISPTSPYLNNLATFVQVQSSSSSRSRPSNFLHVADAFAICPYPATQFSSFGATLLGPNDRGAKAATGPMGMFGNHVLTHNPVGGFGSV